MGGEMPKVAFDPVNLIRIGSRTAELERRHLWGTDDVIDQEFNSVCLTIWGYTLDDFDDDCLTKEDHDWLDQLTLQGAYQYAIENGYDLGDYVNGEIVFRLVGVRMDDPCRKAGTANTRTTSSGLEEARRTIVSPRKCGRRHPQRTQIIDARERLPLSISRSHDFAGRVPATSLSRPQPRPD
jgi:hypothetical protein